MDSCDPFPDILYYTALYYILSLSMTSISEFLSSTWELRLLSTSSLLSLFLEVLGTESETFHARQMLYPRAASQPFFLCSTSGPGMGCTLWAVLPFSLCRFISPIHSSAVLRRWISVCNRLLCLIPAPPALQKCSLRNIWEAAGGVGMLTLKALKTTGCGGAYCNFSS